MDVTPLVPAGRQLIEGYGDGRFRISGTVHEGAVLVLRDRTLSWSGAVTAEALAEAAGAAEVLLVGLGRRFMPLRPSVKAELKALGLVAEAMDTGAACRTFNVLNAEDRRVAAALLPIT